MKAPVSFLLLLWLVAVTGCSKTSPQSDAPFMVTGPTMGTTWSLQGSGDGAEIQALVQGHLDQREAVFSHWKADSPLSRFNASTNTDWFPVPLELVKIVQVAREIAQETDDALDITVASLVDAWGFGPGGKQAEEAPRSFRQMGTIGWHHLVWREDPPAMRKSAPDIRINVSSVAEGFVMDELVVMLKAEGLNNFLLEVGGEVVAIGHAPEGGPWQVGIQAPDAEKGHVVEKLPLTDLCIGTSGSYRHQFEEHGRSYSHIMDPRVGKPIRHKLVSVSVIHPRCVLADGYATALMVLGPEEGRKTAQRLGLRVVWLEEP